MREGGRVGKREMVKNWTDCYSIRSLGPTFDVNFLKCEREIAREREIEGKREMLKKIRRIVIESRSNL